VESPEEFRQAGRSGNVAFAVGHTVRDRQIARQGRQRGGIHVAQAIEQRAQFRGIRLVPAEREQVVAVNHQQSTPAIPVPAASGASWEAVDFAGRCQSNAAMAPVVSCIR